MTLVPKTATIQVRVVPIIKQNSEEVLKRLGLTMSQAVELFLRRMIVEERIPFEVVALQNFMISGFTGDRPTGDPLTGESEIRSTLVSAKSQSLKKRHRPGKELKKFFGARTPSRIRSKTDSEKGNS